MKPFAPTLLHNVNASTAAKRVTMPTNGVSTLVVDNFGNTGHAFVEFGGALIGAAAPGNDAAIAKMTRVPANTIQCFSIPQDATHVSVSLSTGTGNVFLTFGNGE